MKTLALLTLAMCSVGLLSSCKKDNSSGPAPEAYVQVGFSPTGPTSWHEFFTGDVEARLPSGQLLFDCGVVAGNGIPGHDDCSGFFEPGILLTLRGTGGLDTEFDSFVGDCAISVDRQQCVVPASGVTEGGKQYYIQARFTRHDPREIRLSVSGNGDGRFTLDWPPDSPSRAIDCLVQNGVATGTCSAETEWRNSLLSVRFAPNGPTTVQFAGCDDNGASCVIRPSATGVRQISAATTWPTNPVQVSFTDLGSTGTKSARLVTSPVGIDCRLQSNQMAGTCSALFRINTQVTLQFVQLNGSIAGWFGHPECGTQLLCTYTVPSSGVLSLHWGF